MRKFRNVLWLLGILATVALPADASATAAPARPRPAAHVQAAPHAHAAQPALHSQTGSVVRFDAAGGTLVVKAGKLEHSFSVGETTRYLRGSESIQPSTLAVGARVRVRYSETRQNGAIRRVASEVKAL